MMKKIFAATIICFIFFPAFSQTFNIGPKAGLNYSRILIDEAFTSENTDYTLKTLDAKGTFTYGAFLRLNFGSFFVQPEVMWSQDKTEFDLTSANFAEVQTYKVNKLDVPMMAGFSIKKTVRLYGGPVATFINDSELQSPGAIFDAFQMNKDEVTWGFQTGIGFDISRISVDFRYEGNLTDLGSTAKIGNETFNFDQSKEGILVTLGILLFDPKRD